MSTNLIIIFDCSSYNGDNNGADNNKGEKGEGSICVEPGAGGGSGE